MFTRKKRETLKEMTDEEYFKQKKIRELKNIWIGINLLNC